MHLKPDGVFIPERSLMKIALIEIPDVVANNPYLEEMPYQYTKQIFKQVGYAFDLRLCLKGVGHENLVSTEEVFEDLEWKTKNLVDVNHSHRINLTITKNATVFLWFFSMARFNYVLGSFH